MKPEKFYINASTELEVLEILVDTRKQQGMLPPTKMTKIAVAAGRLLRYEAGHRRLVRLKDVWSFAGLANEAGQAVVDCCLRLRELFNPHYSEESAPSFFRIGGLGAEHPANRSSARDARLPHVALRDLQWWGRLPTNPHVGRALWTYPDACVLTDARI